MCAPSSRPLPASATSLTTPQMSRFTIARGTCAMGSPRDSHRYPSAMACVSVNPTEATVGLVNVTRGRCR